MTSGLGSTLLAAILSIIFSKDSLVGITGFKLSSTVWALIESFVGRLICKGSIPRFFTRFKSRYRDQSIELLSVVLYIQPIKIKETPPNKRWHNQPIGSFKEMALAMIAIITIIVTIRPRRLLRFTCISFMIK